MKTEEGRGRRAQIANVEKGEGMEKWSYVPVFLPVSDQEHWIRGYDRRSRWYRCDKTCFDLRNKPHGTLVDKVKADQGGYRRGANERGWWEFAV